MTRLVNGGRLIDRSREISFQFNGRNLTGYQGDTLASALLANDERMVGRSFKYHRPRGIVASGPEEPNALMGVGRGHRFEPNQRATVTELFDGLVAESQNHWPSLKFDLGEANAALASLAPIFPAGFYYKAFMYPRAAWKHIYEPLIRRAAGLGKAPQKSDSDTYEHFHVHVDVLVIGGGMAGIAAARAAADSGAQVLLAEQMPFWGGRALVDGVTVDSLSGQEWVEREITALEAMPNVHLHLRCSGAGLYDHGFALLHERVSDHAPSPEFASASEAPPRHRLWRVRAKQIVIASGAVERPLTFACNDVPGVMLASAVRDYMDLYGVCPGTRAVIVANNDDAYRTAMVLDAAGVEVCAVLDVRKDVEGDLPTRVRERGISVRPRTGITLVQGRTEVRGVEIGRLSDSGRMIGTPESVECDLVAMSGGWSPAVHLFSHCGGSLRWDEEQVLFRPSPETGAPTGPNGSVNTRCAGAANGELQADHCLADAVAAGTAAARSIGFAPASPEAHKYSATAAREAPIEAHWFTPSRGGYVHGTRHWVDFQNDVSAADIRLAAQEGYESVEHAKRYTTLGMATDQGKTSNVNGLALLADEVDKPIPEVGVTTFRPPWTPISLGSITGRNAGPLFMPIRKTRMHDWHERNGADFEPVGDWRRPYCFRRPGEDRAAAVTREIMNARRHVGLLDASTLGKITVKGPDAGEFLDLIYTNTMSTLKPGRCRYGLMCNENGFLFDDGVVARIGEDEYLLHTTSGGAGRVHAHLEEWLQTEWWNMKVYVTDVTDQWAQIAVAGPEARKVLEAAHTATDISADALPFMSFVDTRIAECPVRLFRISFSGELSYEIATPANYGSVLWEKLLEAGKSFGIMPYGTEALHVMRAEKGFIMIGDETDGTVTPQDLGLHWAVSKKKADFIGKRAQERADLTRPDRKQLVGLATEIPEEVLPDGAHAVDTITEPPMRTIGHVTSTYHSPTLGRSIALALIERGAERMGETLVFPLEGDRVMKATICDPVFLDKEGARQNV